MKALILGGGGFIGSHLIKRLKAENFWVRSVDLKNQQFSETKADEFIIGDLRNIEFCETVFKVDGNFDEVYQLAADMGGATYINGGDNDANVVSNSVLINVNVAKTCISAGVRKLFFSSSACVYNKNHKDSSEWGSNPENATCRESEAYPANPDNEYGWEKLFSERMYNSYRRNFGLNVRIARFHSIVGIESTWEGGKEKAHSALIRKVIEVEENGVIEVIGDGTQTRTFLYVDDCIDAIRLLMQSDCTESINIGSDFLISIRDYIEVIRDISKKKFSIKYVDGPTGVIGRSCDSTLIQKILNWYPKINLREATERTYHWIESQRRKQMRNVLYVSQYIGHSITENSFCGIGIRGKLIADKLIKSTKFNVNVCFVNSTPEIETNIEKYKPDIILYNYHSITTSFMEDRNLRNRYPNIKHVMVHYDFRQDLIDNFHPDKYHGFNYVISDDHTLKGSEHVFTVGRFIAESTTKTYTETETPIIGFQGFGFHHKGIHKIATKVQEEFDEAIIKLHIPYSYYGDRNGDQARARVEEVKRIITKPGIQVITTHNFMTEQEIVDMMSQNTINCYFYDYLDGAGIASSPDYAIAAKRPIALTKSHQFRNFWDLEPSILIENHTLKEIISYGTTPLEPLYRKYDNKNVMEDYHKIFDHLLK